MNRVAMELSINIADRFETLLGLAVLPLVNGPWWRCTRLPAAQAANEPQS